MLLSLGKRKLTFSVGMLSLLFLLSSCSAPGSIPEQKGYINDHANVLSSKIKEEASAFAEEINRKADVELVVLTMKDIEGPPEEFADNVFKAWNIGGKEPGKKGILMFIDVAKKDVYIKNSTSLDNILTRDRKTVIMKILMNRYLEKKEFSKAVASGVIQIAKILRDLLNVDIKPVYKSIK